MFVTRNVFAESQSSGEFFWHENWRWPNWTLGPGTQGLGHGMDAVFVCKSVVESLLSPFSYLILRRITSWGSGLPKFCIPQKRNEKVWKRSKLVRKNHAWPISLRAVRGLSCGLKKTPRFICSHVLVGSGSLPLHACKSPWGSIAFARESSGPLFCSGGALNRTSLSSRFLTGTLVLGCLGGTWRYLGTAWSDKAHNSWACSSTWEPLAVHSSRQSLGATGQGSHVCQRTCWRSCSRWF